MEQLSTKSFWKFDLQWFEVPLTLDATVDCSVQFLRNQRSAVSIDLQLMHLKPRTEECQWS
jgi:hypothetical protein